MRKITAYIHDFMTEKVPLDGVVTEGEPAGVHLAGLHICFCRPPTPTFSRNKTFFKIL